MLYIILIISLSLNAMLYYMNKSWKIEFQEKLNENNFFEDENVNVVIQRHFNQVHVSVKSDTEDLYFSVSHEIADEKPSFFEKKKNKD